MAQPQPTVKMTRTLEWKLSDIKWLVEESVGVRKPHSCGSEHCAYNLAKAALSNRHGVDNVKILKRLIKDIRKQCALPKGFFNE